MVLAFIIGSNDLIGSLGTSYGAKIISMRKALTLTIIFNLIGIAFFGQFIMNTVGKGIAMIINPLPIALASIIVAIIILYFKIPTSITQIVLGAIIGSAVAMNSMILWRNVFLIIGTWIISPLMGLVLGGTFYVLFIKYVLSKRKRIYERILLRKVFIYLQIFAGCLLAMAVGANDVGVVMGFNLGFENLFLLEALGALGICLGIFTWGRKIMKMIGRSLTNLTPERGFFAQMGGFITIFFFVLLGIPVSPTSVVVSSIMGVGLITKRINKRIMKDVFLLWLVTVPLSIFFGFGITKLLI
jgi:PiT family inorganic phosphate transporter